MRLFIAFELSKEWKENIKYIQSQIKESSKKCRLTNEDNLHLTLHFLGEVERNKAKDLIEDFLHVNYPKGLSISADKLGYFKRRGSKLVWLGCENSKDLQKLHGDLKTILKNLDIIVDSREFTPHITIARDVQIDSEDIKNIELPKFTTIKKPKLSLYQSKFTKQGVKYKSLYTLKG